MNSAQHLWSWLAGKKTYIVAVVSTVYAWGIAQNLWPHNYVIDTALGAGGLTALRMAITSEAKKVAVAALSNPPTLPPTTPTPTPKP